MPSRIIQQFWPVIALLVIITGIYASGALDFISLDTIKSYRLELLQNVEDYFLLSALTFAGLYAAAVALTLPIATLLTLLGGFLFGPLWGTVLVVVSATLGASTIFLIARSSVGKTLREKAGPFYKKMDDNLNDNAVSYLLFIRLVPVMPFFIANILPALFNIPYRIFALTTLIGIIPGTFVYTNIGRELGTLQSTRDLISVDTVLAFAVLGLFALLPVFIRAFKRIRTS